MSGEQRTQLLGYYDASKVAPSASWPPSWRQVTAGGNAIRVYSYRENILLYLDGSSPASGYTYGLDAYYHTVPVIQECYIHIPPTNLSSPYVQIPLVDGSGDREFRIFFDKTSASIQPHVPYLLIGIGSHWAVAQTVGSRQINGVRGIEVCRLWNIAIPGTSDPIRTNRFFTDMRSSYWREMYFCRRIHGRGENDEAAGDLALTTLHNKAS